MAVRERMRGAPEPGAPAQATGLSPRVLFLTAFAIGFLRFGVHLGCSVGVLGRDGISAHFWYGLRTNLTHDTEIFPVRKIVKLLGGDGISAHFWYGLRTNLTHDTE